MYATLSTTDVCTACENKIENFMNWNICACAELLSFTWVTTLDYSLEPAVYIVRTVQLFF
jgi:hypothetical protein